MSAADRPSEYLKRTCLICGCNTNQTINIYEPRSGPNIVELIQAKFKFQPLNEDKYLCFSCNNWLINWHSLQANNSNDAESPSGTFRASQVNGGMAHEKRVLSPQHHQLLPLLTDQQSQSQPQPLQPNRSPIQFTRNQNRPIAKVRPRQVIDADAAERQPKPDPTATSSESESPISVTKSKATQCGTPLLVLLGPTPEDYGKRSIRKTHGRRRRGCKKHLSHCCVCGRNMVFYIRNGGGGGGGGGKLRRFSRAKRAAKCRKCRTVCQWRSISQRSITKERINPILVSRADEDQRSSQSQSLRRPLVDGKVVAMLRRLGTTLSREQSDGKLPPIMSPTKPKPLFTRPLEADEVLLNFETAISEVLPIIENVTEEAGTTTTATVTATTKHSAARKKLKYQMSCGSKSEGLPSECIDILSSLPKGLDITLI